MSTTNFTYSELLTDSWVKLKEQFWFLFLTCVLTLAISFAAGSILVLGQIIGFFVAVVLTYLGLEITNNKVLKFENLSKPFNDYKITWHYFLATVLYILIVVIGFILLILPGIYLAVRLQFYRFIIVENKDMKATDALRESMRITKGRFWKIMGYTLIIILINFVGLLALGVGLLVTMPFTIIAMASLYRKLHHSYHTPTLLA
jgi:uncharacterized membrane protein